jgi:hypothetical protein
MPLIKFRINHRKTTNINSMKSIFSPNTFCKNLPNKIVLALCLFFLSVSANAQTEINIAKNFLNINSAKYKLSEKDVSEMTVSSAYLSPTTGWYHVYFNQSYQSIEVYNGILNTVLKDGQVQNVSSTFIDNLPAKAKINPLKISISPQKAIQNSAQSLNLNTGLLTEISRLQLTNGLTTKVSFKDASLSNEKIVAKLYWLAYESVETEKTVTKLALTWNVRIATKDRKNVWNTHVDAITGNILQKKDDILHCNFGTPEHNKSPHFCSENSIIIPTKNDATVVTANSYKVFDYPFESPNHGTHNIVTNPYTRFAPANTGPGSTNGWHNDGSNDYTNTRGNNVYAQEDTNGNDGFGASPTSASGDALDFNYPHTQGTNTASGNQNAAIVNLFYWNNIMHDVLWRYGFDEPSGNFQQSNQGRGGLGNDYVIADAQDGSDSNNADFTTPDDGGNGRMQMYLFSNAGSPAYQPDADFDNGVISHEYGHGWSTRLTGGPANSNCLDNAEQAGEGWSDFALLMFTTNWAVLPKTVASANISRTVGTYVKGQNPVTGTGIRPFPYSYNKTAINNAVTYGGVNNAAQFSQPHGIGSIWATMLWDMTWEIIFQDDFIAPNIYDVPTNILDMKGNIAALKLVNEGLRLQPCSPSFIQSRDAIFQADQLLFNGRYRCAIGKAFARRGLGAYASTGTSTNDRIVVEDFTAFVSPVLSSPASNTICNNQVFNYTANTAASGTYTYSWTRAAVAGISNLAGSGNSATINETLVNTTVNPITVQYLITISPNTCGSTSAGQPVNVVVNPSPIPTVGAYSVCQNSTVPSGQGLVVPLVYKSSVSGTLVTGTTYQRGSGDNTSIYSPSSAGTAVYFKTYTFIAPTSGATTFETTASNLSPGATDDTYLSLYQTSFNPSLPATNFLRGDDDSGIGLFSKLTQNLTAGNTYILVVSTYDNYVTGTFTMQSSTTGFTGGVNNWYLNASGGSVLTTGEIFNPVGLAGSGIPNTATLGSTTFYVANADFPTCRTPTNFTIGTIAGTVNGDATVCPNSNAGTLNLTGQIGSIIRWESSTDNFVSNIITIANTSTSQTYSNLSQTTKYRAVVQNGTCTEAYSTSATVTLGTGSVAGVVGTDVNVCAGLNTGTLTLTGHTGTILRWESSTDNFVSNIVTITNTSTSQVFSNLSQTTKYRAVVQNSPCTEANSVPATVMVLAPAIPVASGAIITIGDAPITLSATGCTGVGFAPIWCQTSDNLIVTMPISPSVTTQYYAKCQQTLGATICLSTKSNDVTLTVNPVPINVVYVNIANAAAPTQNGNSWATAYGDLGVALTGISAGSEVWVAQGVYKPTATTSRTISFNVPSGIKMYGGFLGTETSLNQRNFSANETLLSGDIGTIGDYTDDSYHVLKIIGANNQTVVDGFAIRYGYAANQPPVSNSNLPGGASLQPVLDESGGAIYLQNSNATITNCTIQLNFGIFGAGIYCDSGSIANINACNISGNFATFGGGIYCVISNAKFNNNLISGNKGLGAGMYINHCDPTITNTSIVSNDGFVGGIYNTSNSGYESYPIIQNSILWNNTNYAIVSTLANITYSIIQGGYSGEGNRNLNPQFVSQIASNLAPTITGNYQLTNTSPAIDAGNNGIISLTDKDLNKNLRRYNGGIVEMGAYEFQGSRTGETVTSIVSGNWENDATWDIGRSPLAGDFVIINNNHFITVNNTGTAKNVEIKTNAKIIYSQASSKIQIGF